jgi:predicted DNA binding CopG/RHH family protein
MSGKNKKDNIEYGSTDIDLSHLKAHEIKIRISTMIDEDVLIQLKSIAKQKGTKYQTLLNGILRAFVESPFNTKNKSPKLEDTVRRIVKDELRKKASNE